MDRVFTNGPRDLGSIPCRVILKSQKMLLDTSLVNTRQYKVRIEGKVEQSKERSSAFPYRSSYWKSSSYWKRSLLVALDYGCQLYFTFTYPKGLRNLVHYKFIFTFFSLAVSLEFLFCFILFFFCLFFSHTVLTSKK